MPHEPSGLIGDADGAVQLVGAHTLLAGGDQMDGQNPLVQRHFGTLKDSADSHGEGAGAVIALVDAGARAFALELRGFACATAMRANRTLGPADRFHVFPSLLGVLVERVRYVHSLALHPVHKAYRKRALVRQVYNALKRA